VVLVEVAEDVVERAVVEASEDMEVSRREEEFGRDDVPSAFLCCSGSDGFDGLNSLVAGAAMSLVDGWDVLANELVDTGVTGVGLGLLELFCDLSVNN